jgi:hypothetical protein
MKWLKFECRCGCEFMVAENDFYIENYDEIDHDIHTCPLCEQPVYTDECEIYEI